MFTLMSLQILTESQLLPSISEPGEPGTGAINQHGFGMLLQSHVQAPHDTALLQGIQYLTLTNPTVVRRNPNHTSLL